MCLRLLSSCQLSVTTERCGAEVWCSTDLHTIFTWSLEVRCWSIEWRRGSWHCLTVRMSDSSLNVNFSLHFLSLTFFRFYFLSKSIDNRSYTSGFFSLIIYPNNFGASIIWHYNWFYSILYLPSPRNSITLNSKRFSMHNPFLLSLVCTNSCRFSGPWTYLTVFISLSFSLFRSFSPRSFTPVSVNKPSCISYICLAGFIHAF